MLRNIWSLVLDLFLYLTVVPLSPARVSVSTTTETVLIPGIIGKSIIVIGLFGSNEGATITRVDIRDGLVGTIKYSAAMAALGGGFSHQPKKGWILTPGNSLTVQLSAAFSSYITAEYYLSS
jgi:hypothetical protein